MFELSDAGKVLVHCVIDCAVPLEVVLLQRFEGKIQRAVGEGAEPEAKQLVRLAGVDNLAVKGGAVYLQCVTGQVQPTQGVRPQLHGDAGMVQHPFKHGGIALQRHPLVCILKIAVVPGQEHGHPGGGIWVNVLRPLAPLLHGVVDKDVLVHIIRQGGD